MVAHLAAADGEGPAGRVEDELFRFGQVLQGEHPTLRRRCSTRRRRAEARRDLVRRLLADKASAGDRPPGRARRARPAGSARSSRRRPHQRARGGHGGQRRVAVVRVASAAEPASIGAGLSSALAAQAGGPVRLNVVVDPDLVGGIKVEIGDDVVDGTVRSRLADAAAPAGRHAETPYPIDDEPTEATYESREQQ